MTSKRMINGVIVIIGLFVSCSLDSSAQEAIETSLATSGTTPRPAYPEFTWDHIPLYMHIRKATSYTDEEIEFLARFPLITFEKANGHEDHGSVEAGTLIAARAVKEINPNTTILYYRNVMVHYGGYAANKGLEQIPGALLEDEKGRTKLVRNRVEAYDLSNADLRMWWANTCSSMSAEGRLSLLPNVSARNGSTRYPETNGEHPMATGGDRQRVISCDRRLMATGR